MNNFFSEEKNDFKEIWNRIRKKDFSGNAGQAIKNSVYQFSTNVTTKIGAFIFTVIMARILVPNLFGAYSLALSTILMFCAFSDLGIGQTIVKFVSSELGKGNIRKASSYIRYLAKIKIIFVFLVSLVLFFSAKFISTNYYNKPISLALYAGSAYVLFVGFVSLIQSVLQANNFFRPIFLREIIFQLIRLILIPLLILFLIKNTTDNEIILFAIIISLAITYFLSGIFLLFHKGINCYKIFSQRGMLSKLDKKTLRKFILFVSATILSGVFFGYIDIIMLGKFVSSEYIAFYNVAFNFIGAIIPLVSFSTALLPTFTKLNSLQSELFFKRIVKFSLIFSFLGFLILFVLAPYLIFFIFGEQYAPSSNLLKLFSLLLIFSAITEIYLVYFTAKGNPQFITFSLIVSTILNIILNYILISSLVKYGFIYAVYGATFATIISRGVYLFFLIFFKRRVYR